MSGYITTVTGRRFDPLDPTPDSIELEDIAHALSNICRWGGHTSEFYSVAQHSVLVSIVCPPELAAWGLMHDAAEAYFGDIPRPLKLLLPDYAELEHRTMRVIAEKFGLPWPEPPALKQYDNEVLAREALAFMLDHALHDGTGRPLRISPSGSGTRHIFAQPPDMAMDAFLHRFDQCFPSA
jgi:uncharacterized protein